MHKYLNYGITNNKETIQNLGVMQLKGEKRQNFDPPLDTKS